eukprot:GHUV01032151.1.p1 GENE.GHUV01032151.1~~GHUV01032151.1.p1  ORF type:complete len:102 (-),score=14.25 GHUV01032151.1:80-385(-)
MTQHTMLPRHDGGAGTASSRYQMLRRKACSAAAHSVMPEGMPPAAIPPGTIDGLSFSTITACVVSMMPAMLQLFMRPLRVTLAGSMTPSSSRSTIASRIAL